MDVKVNEMDVRAWREGQGLPIHDDCVFCGTGSSHPSEHAMVEPVRTRPQTHAEVVNARIAAFPRAVEAIINENKDELRVGKITAYQVNKLAVELVK